MVTSILSFLRSGDGVGGGGVGLVVGGRMSLRKKILWREFFIMFQVT